jgi:hypothetical protein
MKRCGCSSTWLSQHHSLHFVLLIKLDRAIHARRLHTLAMSSNIDASCVHSQSFMVCKYCVLRSHTLSFGCLTNSACATTARMLLRVMRVSNVSLYVSFENSTFIVDAPKAVPFLKGLRSACAILGAM